MKKYLLLLSIFLILQTIAVGQSGFAMSPEFFDDSYNEELSIGTYLSSDGLMTNSSATTLSINWEIVNIDIPQEWGLSVSDKDMSYAPGPNITTKNGNPLLLDAGQMEVPFNVAVYPRETSGCGSFDVLITLDTDGSVLDTIEYQVSINDDDCLVTSVSDPTIDLQIEVFPNPFIDYLLLKTESPLLYFTLYNLQGEAIFYKDSGFLNQQRIDLSSLEAGMYLFEGVSSKNDRVVRKVVKNRL